MGIDQARIRAARGPITAVLLMGVVLTWSLLAPRQQSPKTADVAGGDSTIVVPTTQPTQTTSVVVTTSTTLPELTEAIGGLSPEWPEWVQATEEKESDTGYSARLSLSSGDMKRLLVWLSMQNWVATGAGPDAEVWELAAGSATGYLKREADGGFAFSVTR